MSTFLEDVAARAEVEADRTQAVLDKHSIVPQPTAGAPGSLRLRQLRFSGTKTIRGESVPVHFDRAFDVGLTVIASDHNLVGKSTLLWLIRWGLVGRRPEAVNQQIGSWIDEATLDATVDGKDFAVRWNVARLPFGGQLDVAGDPLEAFSSEAGFEQLMAEFMMRELGLSGLPGFQKQRGRQSEEEGKAIRHSWATHFPALHIRGDHVSVLLGDSREHLPGVLLQIFLGLPWVLTHRAADVAAKVLGNERTAAERLRKVQAEQIDKQTAPLIKEIAGIDVRLRELNSRGPLLSASDLESRHAALAQALNELAKDEQRVAAQTVAVREAQRLLDEVGKAYQAAQERRVLRPLLTALAPVHCPRCEAGFDEERLSYEEHRHVCSVCDRPLTGDENGVAEVDHDQASKDVVSAEETLAAAEEGLKTLKARERTSRGDAARAKTQIPDIDARASLAERHRLDVRRAGLAGRVEQAKNAVSDTPQPDEDPDELKVIEAAVTVAEARRKASSTDLLTALGEEIVRVANRFGMLDLEEAHPNLAAHLPMVVGGHPDKFGGRTGGERLRLKIATVVALLRVGETHGVGRHPGLLMIDSPGGEEMDPDDLRVVLEELDKLGEDTSALQIIVATARGPVVRDVIDENRIVRGPEWGPVW